MTARALPLRLPAGWCPGPAVDGWCTAYPVAGRPRPALLYRDVSTVEDPRTLADTLWVALPATCPGLVRLDRGETTCRGGRAAHRVLSAHKGLSTEHWFVAGSGPRVHLFVAVLPTRRCAELVPVFHRMLRTFREPR